MLDSLASIWARPMYSTKKTSEREAGLLNKIECLCVGLSRAKENESAGSADKQQSEQHKLVSIKVDGRRYAYFYKLNLRLPYFPCFLCIFDLSIYPLLYPIACSQLVISS